MNKKPTDRFINIREMMTRKNIGTSDVYHPEVHMDDEGHHYLYLQYICKDMGDRSMIICKQTYNDVYDCEFVLHLPSSDEIMKKRIPIASIILKGGNIEEGKCRVIDYVFYPIEEKKDTESANKLCFSGEFYYEQIVVTNEGNIEYLKIEKKGFKIMEDIYLDMVNKLDIIIDNNYIDEST